MPICPGCGFDYRTADRASDSLASPAAASGSSTAGPLRALGYLGLTIIFLAVVYLGWTRTFGPAPSTSQPIATFAAYVATPLPAADLPPVGTIWFGSSFDATTFEVRDHADTFAAGVQVVVVAHSSRAIPEGQTATLSFDTYDFQTKPASAGGFDVYGMVMDSAFLTPGSHTAILKDVGGNELARGTLTIGG